MGHLGSLHQDNQALKEKQGLLEDTIEGQNQRLEDALAESAEATSQLEEAQQALMACRDQLSELQVSKSTPCGRVSPLPTSKSSVRLTLQGDEDEKEGLREEINDLLAINQVDNPGGGW